MIRRHYLLVALLASPLVALGYRLGAPASRTGAPITSTLSEQTCAAECHNDSALDSGPGSVLIHAPLEYTPDEAVDIRIRVEEDARQVFGFQIAVKTLSNTSDLYDHIGTLEPADPAVTQIIADNYATHTLAGTNQQEWIIRWTPPEGETRPVTIYAVGNAANGNGTNKGDHIYSAQWTMTASVLTGIEKDPSLPSLLSLERAFPNPATTTTTIRFTIEQTAPITLLVYDTLGRQVHTHNEGIKTPGTHTIVFDTHHLIAGLYLYEIQTPKTRKSRPLMVLR